MSEVNQKYYNITLALAGVFQAAVLVRDLAKDGAVNEDAFNALINSIYKIDAPDVVTVYGGEQNVRMGLLEIIHLLGNDKKPTDPTISRYVISMFHLERKLIHRAEMLSTLTRRVNIAISQAKYFSPTHPNVIASLADIYLNTLGTLPYRIQILGNAKYLNQTEIVNKVRAILLAGVRSAVLWQQMGGARWQIIFCRSKLTNMAKQILQKS